LDGLKCYHTNQSSNQINTDKKRFWLGKIQSIDSKILNESTHVSINHFKKMKSSLYSSI